MRRHRRTYPCCDGYASNRLPVDCATGNLCIVLGIGSQHVLSFVGHLISEKQKPITDLAGLQRNRCGREHPYGAMLNHLQFIWPSVFARNRPIFLDQCAPQILKDITLRPIVETWHSAQFYLSYGFCGIVLVWVYEIGRASFTKRK